MVRALDFEAEVPGSIPVFLQAAVTPILLGNIHGKMFSNTNMLTSGNSRRHKYYYNK